MNHPLRKNYNANHDLDVHLLRQDFPILKKEVNGKSLAYLDNAASSQMPTAVINKISDYHTEQHSNIHRAVHSLSETATAEFEKARGIVSRFLNSKSEKEIIFTKGTTSGINLVARGYGHKFVGSGDEILISYLEHHSNIVPWQILCNQTGAKLRVVPINDRGEVDLRKYEELLSKRTKLVAVSHVSNALGTVLPIKEMINQARELEVPVLVDGAQGVPHMQVDVQELDCDFYVFSGHKMCGPSGIGVLFGKTEVLESMDPYEGGGDMILSVSFEKTIYNKIPYKFEAGTPPIAQAIGLGSAIQYLQDVGINKINSHEQELLRYATKELNNISGVRIIGEAEQKAGVISFVIDGVHPHDIGTLLNDDGVAIRTGHHCAEPVMKRFGVPATARASFYLYNTKEEIDQLIGSIERVKTIFGV